MGLGHATGDFRIGVQRRIPHQRGGVVDKRACRVGRSENVHGRMLQAPGRSRSACRTACASSGSPRSYPGRPRRCRWLQQPPAARPTGGYRAAQQQRRAGDDIVVIDAHTAEVHIGRALGLVDQGIRAHCSRAELIRAHHGQRHTVALGHGHYKQRWPQPRRARISLRRAARARHPAPASRSHRPNRRYPAGPE